MDAVGTILVIGPSTGWLYAKEVYSLAQQKAILLAAGANAVEVCLATWDGSGDKRFLSLRQGGLLGGQVFDYRSLHLADVNDQEPERQFEIAEEVMLYCGASVALTHPLKVLGEYPVACYERMVASGIPLALENMDSRKDSGFLLQELEYLVKATGCSFVLDVQHAYEHDSTMKYADDLLEVLKGELAHLYVSGQTSGNNHSLVCKAANAKQIIEFVGRVLSVKNVPLILEGEYATAEELQQEIDFLASELGFARGA